MNWIKGKIINLYVFIDEGKNVYSIFVFFVKWCYINVGFWGMMILMSVKGYVMFIYICFFWDDVMEFV